MDHKNTTFETVTDPQAKAMIEACKRVAVCQELADRLEDIDTDTKTALINQWFCALADMDVARIDLIVRGNLEDHEILRYMHSGLRKGQLEVAMSTDDECLAMVTEHDAQPDDQRKILGFTRAEL